MPDFEQTSGATAPPNHRALVHEVVDKVAATTPHSIAVSYGDVTLTYADLARRAGAVARGLRDVGVGPDTVVGICLDRSVDLIVSILAVLKSGGACLPLDPAYPRHRLDFMMTDAAVRTVITSRPLAGVLHGRGIRLLCVEDLSDAVAPDAPDASASLESLAYVIYTSGSTGRPKGIAMPHRPLSNLIAWQVGASGVGAGARTLQFTSASFDVSFQEIFATLCAGGELVLVDETTRRNPSALLMYLRDQSVARLFAPFVVLEQLAAVGEREPAAPAMREIITAGEQLRVTSPIVRWFTRHPDCALHNHYGPAETHVVTAHALTGPPAGWPMLPPIGKPLPNVRILIIDEAGRPVPSGESGEIYIAGDCLARGYLNRSDLTSVRFPEIRRRDFAERFYRSGDAGRVASDGDIEFLGRLDDQVKIRGVRVEPGEIETALVDHPGVQAAAVVAPRDAGGARRLVAYIVASRDGQLAPMDLASELRAYLEQRLPDQLIPSAIVVKPALPLTPSGKVDRLALVAIAEAKAPSSATVMSAADLERRITDIWQTVLRRGAVGVHDNFFDLGGDSLRLAEMYEQVRELGTGLEWSLVDAFQYPTVHALTRFLSGNAAPAMTGVQERGRRQRERLSRERPAHVR